VVVFYIIFSDVQCIRFPLEHQFEKKDFDLTDTYIFLGVVAKPFSTKELIYV